MRQLTPFLLNFNLFNSLILLGTIQGFIFGFLILYSKKYRSISTYYLMAIVIGISYNNLQYYLSDTGIISPSMMFKTIYIPFAILNPVLLYFYVLTFLNPQYTVTKKQQWLYTPFVLFFLITVIYKTAVWTGERSLEFFDLFLTLSNLHEFLAIILSAISIMLCLKKIKNYTLQEKQVVNAEKYTWLRNTLLILLVVLLLYLVLMINTVANPEKTISFYPLWIANSFLIYWLGHLGIYKYGIREERKKLRSFSKDVRQYSITEKTKNTHIESLEKLMKDDKRFLDARLSLEVLSEELQLSKTHLSRVINTELNCSFKDYINSLRVEEAKKYLLHPEFSGYTLVAIGLEAGFNSKTTFNTAFKKFTGVTPSTYRNQKN